MDTELKRKLAEAFLITMVKLKDENGLYAPNLIPSTYWGSAGEAAEQAFKIIGLEVIDKTR